jgi:UDP-N-acetylglucosamine 2-epimerase
MKKLKVAVVVGTRPEVIRLSRIIPALDKSFNLVLIHTGQNYDHELNEIFFDELGIRKPDYLLTLTKNSLAQAIGDIISKVDIILGTEKPDALLILGDTNSSLSAITAKRRKIPIFHMEAGNRCFDFRVPEELNRKIIDHVADINLPYSTIAREYLLREGLPPDQIIKTGSPLFEVINFYIHQINNSLILQKLKLKEGQYFVISLHREENVDSDKNFKSWILTLNLIAKIYRLPIIVSVHPRTRNRLDDLKPVFDSLVRLISPLGFFDYNKLQISAKAVLSDSGTISEESSILNFPALNIRESHERPESMEEARVMMVGVDTERILQGIEILTQQKEDSAITIPRLPLDYQVPNVSEKIVKVILSYTDYINKVVWRKY